MDRMNLDTVNSGIFGCLRADGEPFNILMDLIYSHLPALCWDPIHSGLQKAPVPLEYRIFRT